MPSIFTPFLSVECESALEKGASVQATLYPRVFSVRTWGIRSNKTSFDLPAFPECKMSKCFMNLFFSLILVSVPLSRALFLPSNSSILQLPSQDTIDTNGNAVPWPSPPLDRYIRNGISLNVTAYGDTLANTYHTMILQAILTLQQSILASGKPGERLHAITTASDTKGNVFVDVGFYSLHPPVMISVAQASDVLRKVWELHMEYYPPKEITESTILLRDKGLALFRMSLRVLESNGQPQS